MPHNGSATLAASLLKLIAGYRRWISPILPPACRFHPTCSEYASAAIATHGAGRGVLLSARRLLRCHPWCAGGVDPVPGAAPEVRGGRSAGAACGGAR
jgi:putative membrane protein insertion efficiency factor